MKISYENENCCRMVVDFCVGLVSKENWGIDDEYENENENDESCCCCLGVFFKFLK